MTYQVRVKESSQCRAIAGLVLCASLSACGGPAAPDAPTQAQVTLTGDATWSGFFGPTNIQMSGTATSNVIDLGTGRQCAVVTKHGSSDRLRQSSLTIRVAEGRESTGNHEFNEVVTACGTGPLR